MKSKTSYFVILLILIISSKTFSQEPKVEWGEIPKADLEMTSYPADTNASALVLYDYGESKFNDELEVEFTRHLRVKIFTQKGFSWGTYSIGVRTADGNERFVKVEGATYSLNDKNEIIKTEFDDDEVFEEKITDKATRYKFTLPALKPGCVIEVRYKIISQSWFYVRDWTFQKDEPVRWSEYKFRFPKALGYAFVKLGYEPWEIGTSKEVTQVFSGRASVLFGGSMASCWELTWAVKNIPALRDEPYITTIGDYTNEVQIQLAGYSLANGVRKTIFTNWKDLVEDLVDDKQVGEAIDVTGDVEDLAATITKGLNNPFDKMKAIYKWVSKSIVWDGRNRWWSDQDMDDVIEYKKGNSADINFLFLSLLKSIDIEGYPVILSTRDNGKIQNLYPMVSQFDYVIAQIKIDTATYLVDATNSLRTYDLLPSKILNTRGLVIKPDVEQWVNITSNKKNIDYSLTVINVDKDGALSGRLEDSYGEYNSQSIRKDMNSKKDIEIVKDLLNTDSKGLAIDSVKIDNRDSIEAPLMLKAFITSDSYAQKNGDLIYINPYLVHRLKENPFKSKERKFAIDYGYKNGDVNIININLPEGYELKDKLQNKKTSVGKYATFSRIAGVADNRLQIVTKMEIKSSIIPSDYYLQLKSFYANIVNLESEQIVIGPKTNTSEKMEKSESQHVKGNND